MEPKRIATEHPSQMDSAQLGLRKLLRQGRVGPASVLACPALISLASASGAQDDGVTATVVAKAVRQAIKHAPEHEALAVLFGMRKDTAGKPLKDRRGAAAKITGVTPETFRVRREPRLIRNLALALLVEMPYLEGTDQRRPPNQTGPKRAPLTTGLSHVLNDLSGTESTLAIGIWEAQSARGLGEVLGAIKGTGGQAKRIKDGYQYVGRFPAHLWKLAAADDHYRTLSYGLRTFPRRWSPLRQELTRPYHYVSIGPGTGEKDQAILWHLHSLSRGEPVVYIPVDISAELLRISVTSMHDIDRGSVEVLPVELDITNDSALHQLCLVVDAIRGDTPILVSLLGNTLANFQDDKHMLSRVKTLLHDQQDLLLLELATTTEATRYTAASAAAEYEGSPLFNRFAMASLAEYTDVTNGMGLVTPIGQVTKDVIKVTTTFQADSDITVGLKDGDTFRLKAGERIELYTSRKYTPAALDSLLCDFVVVYERSQADPSAGDFGLVTLLLAPPSIA